MPIDFPTVKYGDPTVNPPSAPASTDLVQLRTAAGADRVAYLGNLAGIAPVAVANDQALALIGGNWTAYALTAQARTLLAATNQAAQRTAIQAVGLVGNENIDGNKTFIAGNIVITGNSTNSTYFALRNTAAGGRGYTFYSSGGGPSAAGTFGIYDETATAPRLLINLTGQVCPGQNNVQSLGASSLLWTTVYATNATINTSDARLKTDPRQLRDAEFKAASAIARLPAVWRWLNRVHGDENCEPEGKEARKHFGPTVQAAIAVMEANGLDPFAYSFICYDKWEAEPEQWHEWPAKDAVLDDDGNVLEPAVEAGRELIQPAREAGDRYSFRKEELLCFIVRALAQEIDGLSERVAALEAKV